MIEALVDQIQQELNMVLISQTDVVKRHHVHRAMKQMNELRDIVWKREEITEPPPPHTPSAESTAE